MTWENKPFVKLAKVNAPVTQITGICSSFNKNSQQLTILWYSIDKQMDLSTKNKTISMWPKWLLSDSVCVLQINKY